MKPETLAKSDPVFWGQTKTVGRIAGHNNIRTTQRYAHFADAALEAVTAVRGEMLANARARPSSPQQGGLKFHDH